MAQRRAGPDRYLNPPVARPNTRERQRHMIIHTTCATCDKTLTLGDDLLKDWHDNCRPPVREFDQVLEQFSTLVEKLMQPNPTADDERQFDAAYTKLAELEDAPPKLGPSALYYAQHYGWPVFPLVPGDKRPLTKNGFYDATTDAEQIKKWWTANPDANIGLPTGIAFDVIDVDLPDGPESLKQMTKLPDIHGRVRTASRGLHLLIEPTGEGNTAGLVPGIDMRGKGGYVVAPPSWRGNPGERWTWLSKPSPTITRRQHV